MFFARFLATAGLFDRWVRGCLLHYKNPDKSRPRDVLSMRMLVIPAGSKRRAHVARMLGDVVAAKPLGMRAIVSEDSERRAL